MENSIRKVWLIILVVAILTVELTSCGIFVEKGGVINVENNRTEQLYVHITDTNGHRDGVEYTKGYYVKIVYPKDEYRSGTVYFEVKKDGTYWLYVNGIRYKDVSVSGGEDVYVTID